MWSMSKIKLSPHDLSDQVRSMTKTRQDNDMIDGIGAVYAENETELSKSIEPVQSMTKIRKDNDMIDCIGTVYAKCDTELS